MTAPARISQADIERAARAAKNAGWPRARLKLDLVNRTIDIMLFEGGESPDATAPEEWSDEDV